MEAWKKVWREGVAPELSIDALKAIRKAILEDDPRLLQGATTSPPPLTCVKDWPCEGACLFGYAGWVAEGLETVGQVEDYFTQVSYRADVRLQEPGVIRHFLNWFDDTPRDKVRSLLLPEINAAIVEKGHCPQCSETLRSARRCRGCARTTCPDCVGHECEGS